VKSAANWVNVPRAAIVDGATFEWCRFGTAYCVTPAAGSAAGNNTVNVVWPADVTCASALSLQCRFGLVVRDVIVFNFVCATRNSHSILISAIREPILSSSVFSFLAVTMATCLPLLTTRRGCCNCACINDRSI
jgi:hypothetical protein